VKSSLPAGRQAWLQNQLGRQASEKPQITNRLMMLVRDFFENLDKFWRFDGATIMHGLVIMPAVFVLPVWRIFDVLLGSSSSMMPTVLDIVLRAGLGVVLAFLAAYVFHLRYGFDEVRTSLIAKVVIGCIFVLLVLQIAGVINLIPG
jgi:hypothetical protein